MWNGGGKHSNAELQIAHMREAGELALGKHDASTKLKRKKPTVLDEDDYTDAVEKIITRDFFPDLQKTRITVSDATAVGWLTAAAGRGNIWRRCTAKTQRQCGSSSNGS